MNYVLKYVFNSVATPLFDLIYSFAMSFTPEELRTNQFYESNASQWDATHSTPGFWKRDIVGAFKTLLPKGRILEVGCGGGRDAKKLIEAGYNYVGVDITPNLMQIAKERNPEADFSIQSAYDLGIQQDSCDGCWCTAVLLHMPKSRVDKALGEIHRVVRPGGVGFIVLKEGQGEKMDGERFFSYYSKDEFDGILERNGFEVVDSGILPARGDITWLSFFVRVEK
jgi:SAM-dependent methyltransferase